ncbi:MAG: ATP-binding protein, partial [Thermoplasmata archaeon]
MDLQVLIEQNPWWVDPKRIDEDPQIREFDTSPVRWVPGIKRYLHLDRDVIYTLRGPRQVGKTTLLKIIIRDLLKEVSPFRILYFTVDMLSDHKELVELITTYQEYLDGMGVEGRRYILLDEISSVEQWVKAIKYLADTGRLKNSTLILTGSHSLDIKEASERLPGRRGEG